MIETIGTLLTAVGLGVGAGVNAWATFLVFGLLSRLYPAMFSGTLAEFFSSTPVLVVVAVLYVIEFLADKFPLIDHAWDAVHTFIRPLAGALIGFAASSNEVPPELTVLASVLGGGAALGSHLTKSAIRATSTATTGGMANPAISIFEDVFAVLQALLAVFLPYLFLALAVIVIVGLAIWLGSGRPGRAVS
ncbi:MAG TPA: DUF4126 domain-containing protein [Thermoanaerobaculia bacterium]|nr:DUF4126 domain-containing protein [Thermoanaerobaculia bacterium]